jgi:bifunctional UDP-N-acetylglucosamine pyrophosphorylase/glucosamine-1-phosphate N-acetyltransferase
VSAGSVLVLAAGRGTRMRSSVPKVLHRLCGLPMVAHVARAALHVARERDLLPFVVVSTQAERVQKAVPEMTPIHQGEPQGTGHALAVALPHLPPGPVLVVNGDMPLLTAKVLGQLWQAHQDASAHATLATARLQNPRGYGRIVRDPSGQFLRVVEEADASPSERAIREVNAGMYVVDRDACREALGQLAANNAQGEYYLPDLWPLLRRQGYRVQAVEVEDPQAVQGVNDRYELAVAEEILYRRRARELGQRGVTLGGGATARVDMSCTVEEDAYLGPCVRLGGRSRVGPRARVEGSTYLQDSWVEAGAQVTDSWVTGALLRPGARVTGGSRISPAGWGGEEEEGLWW